MRTAVGASANHGGPPLPSPLLMPTIFRQQLAMPTNVYVDVVFGRGCLFFLGEDLEAERLLVFVCFSSLDGASSGTENETFLG